MLEWGPCPRKAGPRLSSSGERERNAVMSIRVGVNMLQFCSFSNSHTTLSIKWEVYFSKELCRSSSLRRYVSACIYVLCDYTTWCHGVTPRIQMTYDIKRFKLVSQRNNLQAQGSLTSCSSDNSYFKNYLELAWLTNRFQITIPSWSRI